MRHLIDPLVDLVFKALFGDPAHADLLLSLINELTGRDPPVVWVEILNPFSVEEFLGDDLRVVDVRARDALGVQFQLEIQLEVRPWLRSRVLYTWADLYQGQLQRGEHFRTLQPLVSLWILRDRLLPEDEAWHHRFQLRDQHSDLLLTDQLDIHTVELCKWRPSNEALASEDPWLYFLKEAKQWTALPPALRSPLLEKAMSVLQRFSDKTEDYHRYQARMNHLREQAALADWHEEVQAELRAKLEAERAASAQKDLALKEQEHALKEQEHALARLRAQLLAAGLDPER